MMDARESALRSVSKIVEMVDGLQEPSTRSRSKIHFGNDIYASRFDIVRGWYREAQII